jgi:hypothetical protein
VVFGPDTISKEKNISILNSFGVTECFGMLLEKSIFFCLFVVMVAVCACWAMEDLKLFSHPGLPKTMNWLNIKGFYWRKRR